MHSGSTPEWRLVPCHGLCSRSGQAGAGGPAWGRPSAGEGGAQAAAAPAAACMRLCRADDNNHIQVPALPSAAGAARSGAAGRGAAHAPACACMRCIRCKRVPAAGGAVFRGLVVVARGSHCTHRHCEAGTCAHSIFALACCEPASEAAHDACATAAVNSRHQAVTPRRPEPSLRAHGRNASFSTPAAWLRGRECAAAGASSRQPTCRLRLDGLLAGVHLARAS